MGANASKSDEQLQEQSRALRSQVITLQNDNNVLFMSYQDLVQMHRFQMVSNAKQYVMQCQRNDDLERQLLQTQQLAKVTLNAVKAEMQTKHQADINRLRLEMEAKKTEEIARLRQELQGDQRQPVSSDWDGRRISNEETFPLAQLFENPEFYLTAMGLSPADRADVRSAVARDGTALGMMKCLNLWLKRSPNEATFGNLIKILKKNGEEETAKKVQNQFLYR